MNKPLEEIFKIRFLVPPIEVPVGDVYANLIIRCPVSIHTGFAEFGPVFLGVREFYFHPLRGNPLRHEENQKLLTVKKFTCCTERADLVRFLDEHQFRVETLVRAKMRPHLRRVHAYRWRIHRGPVEDIYGEFG